VLHTHNYGNPKKNYRVSNLGYLHYYISIYGSFWQYYFKIRAQNLPVSLSWAHGVKLVLF